MFLALYAKLAIDRLLIKIHFSTSFYIYSYKKARNCQRICIGYKVPQYDPAPNMDHCDISKPT